MLPLRRNAMTMHTLRRSRDLVLVLRRVLVSGPITDLAASTLGYNFFGGACQALVVDARRVHKDIMVP